MPGSRIRFLCFVFALTATLVGAQSDGTVPWPGTLDVWRGFQRYSFECDTRPCRVTVPMHTAPGNPWVWRARFPDYHPEADLILLERGFHVAYVNTDGMLGSPRAMRHWEAFYAFMTEQRAMARRVALEAVSRGGLFAYAWASRHPDRVACIYGDVPVCDIKSWPLGQGRGRGDASTWKALLKEFDFEQEEALAYRGSPIGILEPIAATGIPLLHVVSLNDLIVPPDENTFVLAQRYREFGGRIDIMEVKEGTAKSGGHHFTHPDPLFPADFMERHGSVTPDPMDYFVSRGSLDNCRLRFTREKKGRVVFLGGSITYGGGWRDMVCDYLRKRFPATQFEFVNAGIPSTGSTPGAFRLLRDVFGKGQVDLLFEEAAVNDSSNGRSATEMTRGMEGIIRHARREDPNIDIVVMHFVDPDKMTTYRKGATPLVVQQHEAVASRYAVTTLHLAREVTERIDAGQFSWQKDFKNLHPSPYGHRLYASSIRRVLSDAWEEALPDDAVLTAHPQPDPIDPFCYDGAKRVDPGMAVELDGFALVPKCDPRVGVGGGVREGFCNVPMLVGTQAGQSFRFPFKGRAAGLWVAAGPDAGVVEFRVDEGEWRRQDLFTPWSRRLHLPWVHVLAPELDSAEHVLSVRLAGDKNAGSKGHACRVVHLLVNE